MSLIIIIFLYINIQVCESSAVFAYIENFLLKKIPNPFGSNHYEGDDPLQNGGDIIFNQSGELIFEHLGNASSRPEIANVIQFIKSK